MTFFPDTETYDELLAVCSDGATPAHRAEATQLLATELVSRLSITNRNHNPPSSRGANWHPAWDHLTAFESHEFLGKIVHQVNIDGGPSIADFYRTRGRLKRHRWIGTVPQEPRPQAEYDLTLVAVEIAAATLVAAAQAAMPTDLFEAAQNGDVARARLLYTATPGNRHNFVQTKVPSGWSFGGFDIVVPTNGNYFIEFIASVHSTDPTVNADIPVRVSINGVEEEAFTEKRISRIDRDQPTLATVDDLAFFPTIAGAGVPQEAPPIVLASLTGGDAIEIRNGSGSFDHTINGRVRIWPEAPVS